MAKKLQKAEQRHNKDLEELEKLRVKMSKMRANCSHVPVMDEEQGVFLCKDCGEVIGYTKQHEDTDYEEA